MALLLVQEAVMLVDLRLEDIISTAREMGLDTVDVHFRQHSSKEATRDLERVEDLPPRMDYTFFTFSYKGYAGGQEKLNSHPQFFGKFLYIKDQKNQKAEHLLVKHRPGWKAMVSKDPDTIIQEQIEARVKELRKEGFESSAYVKMPDEQEQLFIGKEDSLEHKDLNYTPLVFHW